MRTSLLAATLALAGCVSVGTPTSVTVTPTAPDRATVAWSPVEGATKYYIYRADGVLQGSVLAPRTELPVAHLAAGGQACFTVRAEAQRAVGPSSQTACVTQPR